MFKYCYSEFVSIRLFTFRKLLVIVGTPCFPTEKKPKYFLKTLPFANFLFLRTVTLMNIKHFRVYKFNNVKILFLPIL